VVNTLKYSPRRLDRKRARLAEPGCPFVYCVDSANSHLDVKRVLALARVHSRVQSLAPP
jgi:hypothetical protein